MHLGRKAFLSAILAVLGTRSAAIPTRFSNITSVSSSTATPAYFDMIATAASSSLLHDVGEPSRVIPAFNPIATDWRDCNASRPIPADRKLNPTASEQSGNQSSQDAHEDTLATGWGGTEELGTATRKPSTLLNNTGSTSASTNVVGLASILLVPATVTAGHVPTPQNPPGPGAREEQNEDPSLLSAGKQSPHHTTLAAGLLSLSAGSDGRRQMSANDDDTNNAITNDDNTRPRPTMDNDNVVDGLVSAVGDVATLSGANPTVLTQGPTATASPSDALEVLLSALPSDVASSLEAQYSATASERSTRTRPTSRPTARPTSRPSTTSTIPITSTSSSSTSSSITSSSTTFSTSTRSISSSTITSSSPSSTSTNAPPTDNGNLENSAVAGIASGVTAGAVLIILAVVFFLRRRQQGKRPFGPRLSQRSANSGRAYPEVAWLYDPSPTPPNEPSSSSHRREESAASLLPQVREPEMAALYAGGGLAGNPNRSPELRAARPESPLLPPQMPVARDESPGGSPSSSPRSSTQSPRRSARSSMGSSGDGRRPLHAIFEESHAQ